MIDHHDGHSDKTLKLVLTDVTEFHLEQMPGLAAFETSQGARIARDDERLFLDLSGSEGIANADAMPAEWVPRTVPRHVAVADIRKRGFYLDFKNFTSEILQGTAVQDNYFGTARK